MARPRVRVPLSVFLNGRFAMAILDEIQTIAEPSIEAALVQMPSGFPETLSASIVSGVRRRVRLIEQERHTP